MFRRSKVKRQFYARIKWIDIRTFVVAKFIMLPSFNVFRVRAAFPHLWESWKAIGTMEYFKISFGSGKALNYVEYGRDKRFVVEAIWLKTRERKRHEEQEQRDSRTLRSKDLWGEEWCNESGAGALTHLGDGFKRAAQSLIGISLEESVDKYSHP